MSDSAADFKRVVWPVVAPWFGGGELMPVESVTDSRFAELLDMCSGIDAWHISGSKCIRGISSRVQWGPTAWDTFTIRYSRDSGAKTEFAKRKEAIESDKGWLYPHMTVQAYIDKRGGQLLSVACAKTKDLIEATDWIASGHEDKKRFGMRRTGNATFAFMTWDWLNSFGLGLKVFRGGLAKAA